MLHPSPSSSPHSLSQYEDRVLHQFDISSPPKYRRPRSVVSSTTVVSICVSSVYGAPYFFLGLAVSLGYGVASEVIRRSATAASDSPPTPAIMTEANVNRLVSKLSQMRGAALKLGQFMSIQGGRCFRLWCRHFIPACSQILICSRPRLTRSSDGCRTARITCQIGKWRQALSFSQTIMLIIFSLPCQRVMQSSLGADWSRHFTSFDRIPFAAASIGQVHDAVLSPTSSPTGAPAHVAVKIQFPNIADSIASDLGAVGMLLTAGRLLPRGLFLDRTLRVEWGRVSFPFR